jgi:hypothetical protein
MMPAPEQILKSWRGRGECPESLKNAKEPWRDNRDCDFTRRYSRMPSPMSLRPDAYLIQENALGNPLAQIVLEYWHPAYTLRDLIRVEDSAVIDDGAERFSGHSLQIEEMEKPCTVLI